MARKSTIGANPLDAVVPMRRPTEEPKLVEKAERPAPAARTEKERATFHLPTDLLDRTRNAVYWTPGATLAALMEEALTSPLDRLEKKRGEPFAPRTGAIKTGRPIK